MIKTLISKGLPTLLLTSMLISIVSAQVSDPVQVASSYLLENSKTLQLTQRDVVSYDVQNTVISKHNKVTHLYLQQRHAGIPVHNAILNLNILENGEVLSVGNRFFSDLAARVNTTTPSLTMEEAITAVMDQFNLPGERKFRLVESTNPQEATFDHSGLALEPITVKLIYQALPDKSVHLAWNVVLYTLDAQHWYNARVDALTGKVLDYFDQVVHCEFGTYDENCVEEFHGHDHFGDTKNFAGPPPVNNAYRVFPLTIESPNHGTRTLEVAPADPTASPFGWHDTDGVAGHEFTITRGNNVHAYQDIFDQNGSLGDEPDGGDSLNFDFPLDLALGRPYTQLDPATTNLFYWNNLMHDVWYQYGFDEASGNFQANNYGNGGQANDYVRAEALDGSGTNNANFGTPPDGERPRMQMFLWGGNVQSSNSVLNVLLPEELVGDYEFTPGSFGGELPPATDPLISEVVLVADSVDTFSDACEPIANADSIAGKVALIDRGSCEFGFKSLAAENAGAIAVIICNNVGGDNVNMAPGVVGDQVTIPAVFMSMELCNTLKTGLPGLEISISQQGFVVPNPGPTGRDSDLDNGIIAHEYTHGISIRLTGGAGSSGCLSGDEQAGEGWSDWFGLVMTTTPDMTAEQRRGIGTYAINEPVTGDGIRTFPYTRDMEVNPHTYADINGESIPHGVGSVWCAMIWDLFWNLVDEYGYDPDLYNGTGGNNIAMQLVMDGLKMQPCNPNFVDARDAIIDADIANNNGDNVCLIWETFARRGLGVDAQPGGIESFDTPILCLNALYVEKTAAEEADAGGVITYELAITNGRSEPVENATITDILPEGTTLVEGSSSCNFVLEGNELTLAVGNLASEASITCSYQLQVPATPFSYATFEDNVEDGAGNWDFESPIGNASWSLTAASSNSGNVSFFAPDTESESDQYLVISDPMELTGPAPTLTFWHNYNTEANWDGGVVEISTNGTVWQDLGDHMVVNGYVGPVNENPASPISNRPAFHGSSGGWIQTIIDLADYAGDLVQIRFRMACDGAVGGEGWYVDDIQFLGNLHTINNVACVTNEDEQQCSRATTVVYGDILNSSSEVNQELEVMLFPNPTGDQFTVQIPTQVNATVELKVMNIDGRQLLNRRFDSFRSETVDMSFFGAGVYLVQLKTEEGITTKKLIVQ